MIRVRVERQHGGTYTSSFVVVESDDEQAAVATVQAAYPDANVVGPSARRPLDDRIECRVGCGACCVWARIPDPYDGYPNGKAAGERCKHLTVDNRCGIYERRPEGCRRLPARRVYCGDTNEEAYERLEAMCC